MRRTKLAVALVLAGAISAPSAYALGLGAIEVKSALNQPLDARIPLLPADEGELETLSVSLASAAAFQRAGVDRPFSLTRLRFTLVRGDQPYVRVSTEQPVKEPFLDFLVQADWDRGRLVREFTLLLDPPIYAGSGVAPIMAPTPVSGSSHRPTAGAAEVVASGAVTTVSPAATSAVEAAGRRYGPVGPNDTLWKIASELRPADSVSVNQVMIALLRANPDAFIDGDINRLRRGSILQMPELAQIAAINAATANQEVRAQMQRWRQANAAAQPRGRLQVVAPPEDSAREADAARPEQAAADRATLDGLRQEVLGYRESNVSLQAENEDLKAQVEGLKQELAHFERLLSLSVQQPVVAETAAAPAELVADHEAELREAAELAAQPAEATASEQPVAAEATQPKPAEAPKAAPVVPEVREPSFFDEPSNLTTLGGAAAAVLGLLYLLVRRRRAAAEADEAADVVLSAELEQPEEAPLEPVAAEASQEPEEEAAVDLASAAAAAADDLPEGDALSEAEVYLAYGRYDQARELLENAL